MSLLISIPTLFRPERVIETAQSARAATPDARIHVWVSPEDERTAEACARNNVEFTVVPWSYTEGADWARKHNRAYREMSEEWMLLAGDDLHFHPGWFDAALDAAAAHWDGGACVVGTNDMGNSRVLAGAHSTHPLVHRDYIHCGGVVDDPTMLLPQCYRHWWVDDEFIKTAMARRTYAHAHAALVEHLHPNWGKAQDDETYRIGQASIGEDRLMFERRRRLWDPRLTQGG